MIGTKMNDFDLWP